MYTSVGLSTKTSVLLSREQLEPFVREVEVSAREQAGAIAEKGLAERESVLQAKEAPRTWHFRLRPAARRQIQLVGAEPEHYDGKEQAFLLRADGVVCAMSPDGKEWQPVLRAEQVVEEED